MLLAPGAPVSDCLDIEGPSFPKRSEPRRSCEPVAFYPGSSSRSIAETLDDLLVTFDRDPVVMITHERETR
jgi:hypothetical protein